MAVRFATDKPKRTLGILYRDGVATPAWRQRRGVIQSLLTPIVPDSAPIADMMAAVILDSPDLLIGRIFSTFRSMMPEFRRNLRTLDRSVLVGSMLMTVDLRPEIRDLADDPETEAAFQRWAASRNQFNADLKQPGSEAQRQRWQKHYFQGSSLSSAKPVEHQSKLALHPFEDRRKAGNAGS